MPLVRFGRPWLTALVVGAASLLPSAGAVVAASGATGLPVTVRPSDANGAVLNGPGYFAITATPGSTTQLYALVGNVSQKTAAVSVVPVDAATGVYGGITAQLPSQPRRKVGRWIHVTVRRLTLSPDRGRVIPFTVTVPRHERPGQYVGALTAFVPSHHVARGHGFAVTVQTRLADDVVVTVPGARRWGFHIRGITPQRRTIGTYLIAAIHNSGTMMLKGWGYLWIWQPGRRHPIRSVALHIDTTLPRTTVTYPIALGKHPRPGRYSYKLKVWWNGGQAIRHASFRVR